MPLNSHSSSSLALWCDNFSEGAQRRQYVFRIGGPKVTIGRKTLYVYLLTYSILYKNTAYFGVQNDVFAPTIYYWEGNRPSAPMFDAPEEAIWTYSLTVYVCVV